MLAPGIIKMPVLPPCWSANLRPSAPGVSYCVHKVPRNGTPVSRLWLFPRCAKGTDDVSINRPLRLRGLTSLRGREKLSYLGSETVERHSFERGGLPLSCICKLLRACIERRCATASTLIGPFPGTQGVACFMPECNIFGSSPHDAEREVVKSDPILRTGVGGTDLILILCSNTRNVYKITGATLHWIFIQMQQSIVLPNSLHQGDTNACCFI